MVVSFGVKVARCLCYNVVQILSTTLIDEWAAPASQTTDEIAMT